MCVDALVNHVCVLYAMYERLSVLVCLYSCVRLCVYGVRMLLHFTAC